jgi:sigma-E factor negative regulatory protein RseB
MPTQRFSRLVFVIPIFLWPWPLLAETALCPLPKNGMVKVESQLQRLLLPGDLPAELKPRLDAYDWLLRMIFAVEHLEYRGQLIYRHDNRVQSLLLKQVRDASGRHQTFSVIEGAAPEVGHLQSLPVFTAERLPGLRQVLADPEMSVLAIKSLLKEKLAAYVLELDSSLTGEVAKRPIHRLSLLPKDHYRFGYLFDLDQNNGMLLRLQVLDTKAQVLEEFFFTYVHYFSCPEEKAAEAAALTNAILLPSAPPLEPPAWVPLTLLDFHLLTARHLATEPPAKQLVYSDGLAMISVFVRPMRPKRQLSGFFRLSVLHGYQGQVGERELLIIGAVPLATIQAFQYFFGQRLREKTKE